MKLICNFVYFADFGLLVADPRISCFGCFKILNLSSVFEYPGTTALVLSFEPSTVDIRWKLKEEMAFEVALVYRCSDFFQVFLNFQKFVENSKIWNSKNKKYLVVVLILFFHLSHQPLISDENCRRRWPLKLRLKVGHQHQQQHQQHCHFSPYYISSPSLRSGSLKTLPKRSVLWCSRYRDIVWGCFVFRRRCYHYLRIWLKHGEFLYNTSG